MTSAEVIVSYSFSDLDLSERKRDQTHLQWASFFVTSSPLCVPASLALLISLLAYPSLNVPYLSVLLTPGEFFL